jgi:uncharacterized RDD family membrane protein YckC
MRRHRVAAFLIDFLIFAIVSAPLYLSSADGSDRGDNAALVDSLNPYANSAWPIGLATNVLFAAYFWLQHAWWGQTPGKRLCRLKVVSVTTGEPPSLRNAGLRAVVFPLAVAVPYLWVVLVLVDGLWIFADRRRRCLHDVIAHTVVVDLRDPATRGAGRRVFLTGLGILVAFLATLVLIFTLMAR